MMHAHGAGVVSVLSGGRVCKDDDCWIVTVFEASGLVASKANLKTRLLTTPNQAIRTLCFADQSIDTPCRFQN